MQEEFGIKQSKLLQEMATRWWSILKMLQSLANNFEVTNLALVKADRPHLVITNEEQIQIEEIIQLFSDLKEKTDKLGAADEITITSILPTFEYFRATFKERKANETPMIRLMKNHMLAKLNSRYDAGKIEYLKQCTYLDPRFKNNF